MTMDKVLTVYFDGSCPLCRREVAWYRRRRGADAIEWIDVSGGDGSPPPAPGLNRDMALARFHVRLSDGRLLSGARAFAELWAALPGLRGLARLMRSRPLSALLEVGYRAFLRLRPSLQRAMRGRADGATVYPKWLERELRSDHAGESGAVAVYRGILAVSRDPDVCAFARRHRATEVRHLAALERLLPKRRRSRLLPLWRAAGFVTGALPALFGPRAVYATVDAVESFVDGHYARQIDALDGAREWAELRRVLRACRQDELEHRDEARASLAGDAGAARRLWRHTVGLGSAIGVALARRL